jgi:hypothetical protein
VTAVDTRRRMRAFNFDVRRPDGSVRRESFYAVTKAEAAKLAHGWTVRMGYRLEGEKEGESA